MNNKRAGALFMSVTLVHIILVLISKQLSIDLDNIPGALSLILGQLIMIVPTVLFLVYAGIRDRANPVRLLGFKKIKTGTVFLMILIGFLTVPIATFINLVSMIFTKNVVVSSADKILSYPAPMVILFVGILAPLAEETACRGAIFGGMKRDLPAIWAIILSALAFGLIHMNLNQFTYAAVIGIVLALSVEATGSLWSSVLIHMTINCDQMIKMLLVGKLMPGIYADPAVTNLSGMSLYVPIAIYLILGCTSAALMIGILIWAAKREGRLDALKNLTKGEKKGPVITIPYVIGVIAALAFIIIYEIRTS